MSSTSIRTISASWRTTPNLTPSSEQHLAQRTAPWNACLRAAEEGLIDLNVAGESVSARPHHYRPIAVQHRPGSLVGPELHLTAQLGIEDAAPPAGQVPGRRKPDRQRRPRAMKDRPCGR